MNANPSIDTLFDQHKMTFKGLVFYTYPSSNTPNPFPASDDADGSLSKKPRKSKPETNPHHRLAVTAFTGSWQSKYGARYPFSGGKDARAVASILAAVGNDLDQFRRLVETYLRDGDKFLTDNGHSLSLMQSRLPGLLAASKQRATPVAQIRSRDDIERLLNPPPEEPWFTMKERAR